MPTTMAPLPWRKWKLSCMGISRGPPRPITRTTSSSRDDWHKQVPQHSLIAALTFAICLVMPVVPVRPIVAIQVPVGPVPVAVAGSATVPAPTTTGSTASHRVFATRRGTVLRYREGNSTRQQYCRHHDALENGHVASPTRRRTHPTSKGNADGTWAVPLIDVKCQTLSQLGFATLAALA